MTPISLDDLANVIGTARPGRAAMVSRLRTDSREVRPGDVYLALRGERFDGHDFVRQAFEAGALSVVVERLPTDRSSDEPVLVVRDTRKTLADIARWHRRTLRGKVVAVAGSNGKTSTK
ncbi:MAG: Mur ligase domain-containing protein, partial [Planctomycetota bacterium]